MASSCRALTTSTRTGPLCASAASMALFNSCGFSTLMPRTPMAFAISAKSLLGIGNQLDIMAAIPEQAFRMCCLEIIDPDFAAGDVGRDCQNRHAVALAVEQAVDQMKVAWTTAPGAHSKASGKMTFSPGRKSRGLFMTHVNPVDRLSSPQRVSKAVERVSHHSVDALHARFLEGFDQIFGCSFAHKLLFPIARTSPRMRAVDLQSRG